MNARICLIINPASAGGRTGRNVREIINEAERHFGKNIAIHFTQSGNDAANITRDYLRQGCELLIAAGGDGTIQSIVNGFFEGSKIINHDCALGIINSGTGQGFAQSISLPHTIREQMEVIKVCKTCPVDIGEIDFCHIENLMLHFVNEFQIGIGGAVVKNVKPHYKQFGGKAAFGLSTIKSVFSHPNQMIYIRADDETIISEKVTGIVIANGAFTGGGMTLAPKADPFDHKLDVLIIKEQSSIERLLNFPKIYSGRHIHNKGFHYFRAHELNIIFTEEMIMEADGELLSSLPCQVRIIPSAINVCLDSPEARYVNTSLSAKEIRV